MESFISQKAARIKKKKWWGQLFGSKRASLPHLKFMVVKLTPFETGFFNRLVWLLAKRGSLWFLRRIFKQKGFCLLFQEVLDYRVPYKHSLCVSYLYLVSRQSTDVFRDEFDPVTENCDVGWVDDAGVGAVHAADLERVGPDLVGAEDVARDVGHHQGN